MDMRGSAAALLVALAIGGCGSSDRSPEEESMDGTATLTVSSTVIVEGGAIPGRFTCDDRDVSPPLAWSGAPPGTAAYALIVDDPDARGWIHWAVADLVSTSVAEAEVAGTQGRNDFGREGWGGPCPPSGTHRYVVTVYALSEALGLAPGFTADQLRTAMDGRILAEGRLTATYRRGG